MLQLLEQEYDLNGPAKIHDVTYKGEPGTVGPLSVHEYQQMAVSTAIYNRRDAVTYPTLGLVGEAGELANKVKKVLRDDNGLVSDEKRLSLAAEIGDVLWYCAALANDLQVRLEDIAQENINKLFSRKERGVLQGSGDTR